MVSHSLNLFWFADVYPTVSHKNCPKKKNKTWDPYIGRVPSSILVKFSKIFNFDQIFKNLQFLPKFEKYSILANFQTSSILVKFKKIFNFYQKLKNIQFGQIFKYLKFNQNLKNL